MLSQKYHKIIGMHSLNCLIRLFIGCVTKSWEQCVFPFKYRGKTYTSCTSDGSSKKWCSTENDADGNYQHWDTCIMETCRESKSDMIYFIGQMSIEKMLFKRLSLEKSTLFTYSYYSMVSAPLV